MGTDERLPLEHIHVQSCCYGRTPGHTTVGVGIRLPMELPYVLVGSTVRGQTCGRVGKAKRLCSGSAGGRRRQQLG